MLMEGRGNANRCRKGECDYCTPGTKRSRSATPQSAATAAKTSASRLHDDDVKVEILGQYIDWVEDGRKRGECPNRALVAKFGCNRDSSKDLYDLMKARGTIQNW